MTGSYIYNLYNNNNNFVATVPNTTSIDRSKGIFTCGFNTTIIVPVYTMV